MNKCIRCGKSGEHLWLSKSGYCEQCARIIANGFRDESISSKDWLTTLLLAIFLGGFGVHRFYVKKIGTGIIWLFTGGCFLIGYIYDIIKIATSTFTDSEGAIILSDEKKNTNRSAGQPIDVTNYAEQIATLAKLKEAGALTQAEFDEKKAILLSKIS